jgi:hypothetical protein
MEKKWYRSKTNWTAITTIVGATAGIATGAVPAIAGAQTIIGALLAAFVRDTIAKKH